MQKCINRQGLIKSVVENLTFPLSGEIFYWGDKYETLQREDTDKR